MEYTNFNSLFICFCCLLFNDTFGQRTAEEWKSRIIYQILTDRFALDGGPEAEPCTALRSYCGGTFQGIVDKLDYIENLGANAIWISPIVQNTNTPNGYHGYWAKNIFETNEYFGSWEDLRHFVEACHERDIWVMIDVVPNHMGYPHDCSWTTDPDIPQCDEDQLQNYTGFTPFDQPEHYHTLCHIEDFENATQVETCRFSNLPDLNQTNAYVRETLYDWIYNLTEEYGIDGYRVDTVRHIAMEFWSGYQSAAHAFLMGEVAHPDPVLVGSYQTEIDSLLNFPSFHATEDIFHKGQAMSALNRSLHDQREAFVDVSVLGLFADNHDVPRFLNKTNDVTLLKNALTYVMFGEGIPIIYYGTEQGFTGGSDPDGRESLWPYYNEEHELFVFIRTLSDCRKQYTDLLSSGQKEIYADSTTLAFTRAENSILILINKLGSSGGGIILIDNIEELEGKTYTNYLDTSDEVTVEGGKLSINIRSGQPKVYIENNGSHSVVHDDSKYLVK